MFETGSIFMLIWLTEDIKRDLNSINEEVIAKENRHKFGKRFMDIIQFYYDGKQLSVWIKEKNIFGFEDWKCLSRFRLTEAFSKPFKPIFVGIFAWSTISICAALLLIQMQIVEYHFWKRIWAYINRYFVKLFSDLNKLEFKLSNGCGILSLLSNFYIAGVRLQCLRVWSPSQQCFWRN